MQSLECKRSKNSASISSAMLFLLLASFTNITMFVHAYHALLINNGTKHAENFHRVGILLSLPQTDEIFLT